MILIVSYRGDEHTDLVRERLLSAGREVVQIDLGDFPQRTALSLSWAEGQPPRYQITGPDVSADLSNTGAVWWRRVRPFDVDPAIAQEQRRAFAGSETAQAVHGMLDALRCPWVNPREADASAHHKPYQWAVAQQLGLRVPRTLVTTEAAQARAFIAEIGVGRVVFKAFLASIEEWRETRLVQPEDVDRLELLRYAPVIFQEYVPGVDLRITLVGDQLFAAEIDARHTSYPVDMRMVVGEGHVAAVKLPAQLRRCLLALQARLNLRYGAIDMRRSDDGEYFFLEVNPAGQWLFVEQRTGLPITQAVADLLAGLDQSRGAT
jgi:glutathione synthase/RimK-type ligase-like ATP-grasp enzyme